ncbi:DUF4202 domain-containing protein [Paenalcaligenes niemegkensis]|uniref:DUF4202 family protein n=1 Tax=Paenalcaligenes niemegkensis TaxID=2895469 RepID=UPI001EE843E5|nr:DUF4202 family protein [Paenalcaligenes niemegkensis]MCQ9617292.1 DUF4202 domain-containing protein [Paenalcaligenes niemegkensis]
MPEDLGHAKNTLEWLLRLNPDADHALMVAAYAHDIERARPDRYQRHMFANYDDFKRAHAREGSLRLSELLRNYPLSQAFINECARLVEHHEHGGDARSDVLKDADSLSYFDHNLAFYYEREGYQSTLKRARWGYQRLSSRAQARFHTLAPEDPVLQLLLREAC